MGSSIPSLALFSAGAGSAPMGYEDARQLLDRSGFGATEGEITDYAGLSREQAVERLLAAAGTRAYTPPPPWVSEPVVAPRAFRDMSPDQRKAAQEQLMRRAVELKEWWMLEMLVTPSQLTEKMTLFWHNHFVSSEQKVHSPQLMYRQNLLLRKYALGNFAGLLHEIAKDPAMIIYLDSASNRKGQPNENFAREVMELFTLGEGHYSEQDVKEAARAFTGWSIDADSGEFQWRPNIHDDGVKTILGRMGAMDGDAVLDILLAQPQTAEFIVAKLWREFISPLPDAAEVKRIAGLFRDSRYDIRSALRALFACDAFYAQQNRAILFKSPIELVVGTLRVFKVDTGGLTPFVMLSRQLGQDLFAPPNVKGWPGGEAWINSSTLLARRQFLERLFRAEEMRPAMMAPARAEPGEKLQSPGNFGMEMKERVSRELVAVHFDAEPWLRQFQNSGGELALQRLLLAMGPENPPGPDVQGLEFVRRLTQDPVYQLK